MPTNIVAAPTIEMPCVAFPLAWLPVLFIVALGACQLATSLRYPDVAASIADVAGP